MSVSGQAVKILNSTEEEAGKMRYALSSNVKVRETNLDTLGTTRLIYCTPAHGNRSTRT